MYVKERDTKNGTCTIPHLLLERTRDLATLIRQLCMITAEVCLRHRWSLLALTPSLIIRVRTDSTQYTHITFFKYRVTEMLSLDISTQS